MRRLLLLPVMAIVRELAAASWRRLLKSSADAGVVGGISFIVHSGFAGEMREV